MHLIIDTVLASRLQFALTAIFHIIWPVLSVGLSWFIVLVEGLWLKTADRRYYDQARFWTRILLLNFAIGVVSGIPLEFEFGTNWAPLSRIAGDFLGNILGFEGAMAFMLEAGFIGIMAFGWRRVSAGMHWFASLMVAGGASLSVYWIMIANNWMQVPVGGHLQSGHYVVEHYLQAMLSPSALISFAHMWVASIETTLFVIAGISAGYLLRNRHHGFSLQAFRLAVVLALVFTPLQIWLGDLSGRSVYQHQPAKLAAMEGVWDSNAPGTGADWLVAAWPDKAQQGNRWSIAVPDGLSLLLTHDRTGPVQGLKAFTREDQPPVLALLFYSFRIMVAVGLWLFALTLWTAWVWLRGRLSASNLTANHRLLLTWVYSTPLAYVAVICGWIVREVGRQPWAIYGLSRTRDVASHVAATTVSGSLILYVLLYSVLFVAFVFGLMRILRQGPQVFASVIAATETRPLTHASLND